MVPSDCSMFIWNYLLCTLFLWMEQGGIFCTFPFPSISKSPFFILYIDIWRTVSTVPSYPHLFSLSNLPPPPTSSSFSVDIGRRVSMPSTYHPLLRFFVIFRRKFRGESPINSPFLQQSLPFPIFPTYPSNFHLLPNDRKGSAECLL